MSEESRATLGLATITKWFGVIMCGLVLAGVIGIFAMANEQTAIKTTVIEIKDRLIRWDSRVNDLDTRLRQVEIGRGSENYVR